MLGSVPSVSAQPSSQGGPQILLSFPCRFKLLQIAVKQSIDGETKGRGGSKMSVPSASSLSVSIMLRVTKVKHVRTFPLTFDL